MEGSLHHVAEKTMELLKENSKKGLKVGVLATEQTKALYSVLKTEIPDLEIICSGDRDRPETIASQLFHALREFDDRGVHIIFAEAIDSSGIGMAIMNRMNKAAGYKVINADKIQE